MRVTPARRLHLTQLLCPQKSASVDPLPNLLCGPLWVSDSGSNWSEVWATIPTSDNLELVLHQQASNQIRPLSTGSCWGSACSCRPQPQAHMPREPGPSHPGPIPCRWLTLPWGFSLPATQNHSSVAHMQAMVFSDARTPKGGVLTLFSFASGQQAAKHHPPFWLHSECARPGREAGRWARVAAAAGPAVLVPECPIG